MKLGQKIAVGFIRAKFKVLSAISPSLAAREAFKLFCTPQLRNRKKPGPVFQKAELLQFSFEDYLIRGYRWNKDAGKRVLIVHGFESSVVNFDEYITAFVEMGFEVLAFDAPAHGGSSGKTVNALTYRNFLIHICRQYGPVESFFAHSFGGLALGLALEELQLTDIRVALIAPATETKTAVGQFFQFVGIKSTEVARKFEDIIRKISGHGPEWFSTARTMEAIQAKILWVHDKEDRITPYADIVHLIEKKPEHIQFVITEGLGHRKIYRDKKIVKLVVDHLSGIKKYSYLALGDSYTIGESVDPSGSFPMQLAELLGNNGYDIGDPEIIAKTGWTTGELKEAIIKAGPGKNYDLVTLLIGVNNQYRGLSAADYSNEFEELLQMAISFVANDSSKVVVLSIPDWGVTPYAEGRDRDKIAKEIDEFNRLNREITARYSILYIDITPDTRKAANDLSLLTGDGLHPSAKAYEEWAMLVTKKFDNLTM